MGQTNSKIWDIYEKIVQKDGVSELAINAPDKIFVEKEGRFFHLNEKVSKSDILNFISELASYNKKKCNSESPIMDAHMPDGSRVNVILEPFSVGFPAITIRVYSKKIKSFDTSPGIFNLDSKWVKFFKALSLSRVNTIVSGGTGVGKTTFLNLLLQEISPEERIVTIEDTLELAFDLPNVVRLESSVREENSHIRLTFRDLVKNTLRMRPDRIIIGETRGGEVFDLLQAMNTGHEGSMTTIHANSPSECLSRLETLYMLAGFDVPMRAIRKQMASAIDFIIQLGRTKTGERIVTRVMELTGMEGENFIAQDIAINQEGQLKLHMTPSCYNALVSKGGLEPNYFSKSN